VRQSFVIFGHSACVRRWYAGKGNDLPPSSERVVLTHIEIPIF